MKRSPSPRVTRWIAGVLLPPRDREFILGDLEELHALRTERDGRRSADRRYRRDALRSVTSRLVRSRASPRRSPPTRPSRPRPVRDFVSDLVLAGRSLWREAGFSTLTILTLAIGVGSTAAIFGMANQLLLRPLPGVSDPGGAAYLQLRSISDPESIQGQGIALLDFDELRVGATLLEGVASYGRILPHISTGDGRPIEVVGNTIYGDFFEVLGVRPAAGRLLSAEETSLGADPLVAVISEDLRRRLFGMEDPVGRTLRANGQLLTVVGVAGGGFRGPERGDEVDMWVPHPALVPLIGFTRERLTDREAVMHDDLIVRPRPGVDPEAAESQVAEILARLAAANPGSREWLSDLRPELFPGLHVPAMWRATTYASLRLLAGVVALVLLIACANVANLLLFRNVSRRGAVATRRALGASPGRIARYHLAESLLLAVLGTGAGLGVAWLIALPFRGESLLRMPAFEGFAVDGRVLAFAAAVSIATAVLFGTLPAALAGRFDLGAALRESGGRETRRLAGIRWLMSAAQVALCLTLLVGSLLLGRTLHNLYSVDAGLSVQGVSALPLELTRPGEPADLHLLQRELLAAVTRLPAVEGAALDLHGPHGSSMMGRVAVQDVALSEALRVKMWPVTPGWFELLDVETVAGRSFREPDWEVGAPGRVVLTASLARRLFGRTDVVGRSVRFGFRELEEVEVVGVTEDLRAAYAMDRPEDAAFVPYGASPRPHRVTLLVRTRDFGPRVAREIRGAVEAVLPDQPVADPVPLAERVDRAHSERRIFGRLLGLLSALAVVLAAVGLYGVIAFAVAGRTREFGIRLALGADGARLARLVMRYAGAIVAAGTAAGLAGAFLLSRVLESRLFGVEPLDAASYSTAVLLFAAVAALACWRPARAAWRVDPVETLRGE